jgi:hypothetical protein
MDEKLGNQPKRRYRWPWVVLAALILQALLVILWVGNAVRHVEQQRDFSAPATGVSH